MITTLSAHRRIDPGGAVRRRTLRSLALAVVTALVATFGVVALAAPASAAPGPVLTVTPTADLDVSVDQALAVTGSGFSEALDEGADGVYLNVGVSGAWTPGSTPSMGGWLTTKFLPKALIAADGSFSTTVTVPADSATAGTAYQVASFCAHGCSMSNRGLDAASNDVTFVAPAPAPVPALSVDVTSLDAGAGGSVQVTGTGYGSASDNGFYVALIEQGLWTPGTAPTPGTGVLPAFIWLRVKEGASTPLVLDEDGGWTATLPVAGGKLTAGKSYEVITFASHMEPTNRGLDAASAAITATAPAPVPALSVDVTSLDAVAGGSVQVTGTGYGSASVNGFYVALLEQGLWTPGSTPTPGTGVMAAFIWLRGTPGASTPLVLDEDGGWTATLPVAGGKLTAGKSYEVITFASHMEPTNRGLDAASAAITATGSSVDPEPEEPPATGDHVVNVSVKNGTATITGSGFAEYAARDGLYLSLSRAGLSGIAAAQADSAKVADFWATTSGRYGATLKADGTFTITTAFAPTSGVDYAVYVADVNGHAPIDLLSVPVTVPTGGSGGSGGTGGSDGKTPSTPPAPTTGGGSVSGLPTSGAAAGNARPGEQFTITAGGFAPHETGIVLELHSDPVVLATGLTADANGVVRYSFTVPAGTPAGAHTLVLKGATHTANVPLAVAEPLPVCVARVVSGASVTWGVKADFRDYVTGSVASGTIATSGVSGSGPWTWSGGSGTFNTVDTVGRASFSGGVTFTGHGGVLDVSVSNLRVQVNTPSSGTLIGDLRTGDTNRTGIALATLNLAAGSHSASGTQVSWSGVPATLTSAGAAGFEGFYTAGTAMDAVSFTMPLGAETACTSVSGANAGKYLASTGSDLDLAGLALLLLLGGGLMVVVARRLPRHATARTTPGLTQG